MPVQKLKEYLDAEQIKYTVLIHSTAYTAQEVAESAHLPGKEVAKTVMVKIDGKMAMAVLPAPEKLDLDLLKGATGADSVELATEDEFMALFPNCDVGAMPPFGNLYDMPVYVDEILTEDELIGFNAGSHTELIRLSFADFDRLVQPQKVRIASSYAELE